MQISKSSWHYRFTDTWLGGFASKCAKGQHTTCSYIRAVFYALVGCILTCSFLTVLAVFAASLVGSMISVPVIIFFFGLVKIPELMLGFAMMGWIAVAIGLFIYLVNQLIKHGSEWSEKRHTLMIQAMQDKKDGICTIVRIQD